MFGLTFRRKISSGEGLRTPDVGQLKRHAMAALRGAADGEALELRRMKNGRICWTAAGRALSTPKIRSKDEWFTGVMNFRPEDGPAGLDVERNVPDDGHHPFQSKYGGLYTEWLPVLRRRFQELQRWVRSHVPRRRPARVSVPQGLSLRVVRASTFVRHLCELCGSDIVIATRIAMGAGEAHEAIQLDDGGYLLLQELDEGTCVEVIGRGRGIQAGPPVADAGRPVSSPVSMNLSVKEQN